MVGQFAPLYLRNIVVIDLALPALIASEVFWTGSRRIFVSPIAVDDRVVDEATRMSKHRCARNRGRLAPLVLFGVVHLDNRNSFVSRPTADGVNVTIAINAGYKVIEWNRHIRASIPDAFAR